MTDPLFRPWPWQQASWDQVHQQVADGRMPHGLLLQGAVDSGINEFAVLLAQSLLCQNLQARLPCGRCRACLLFLAGSHPDYQYLTLEPMEKSEKLSRFIKVEQVREIMDALQQSAMQQGNKVIVIYPADAMNPNAANALLKILEEPPAHTLFILASNQSGRMMATIRSRCQVLELPLPAEAEAKRWLEPYIKDAEERSSLLALAGQNPLLVRQWLDQGQLETVSHLGKDLQQVQARSVSPLVVAARWNKQGSALTLVQWWWRWLARQIKQQAETGEGEAIRQQLLFLDRLQRAKGQLESSANPNEQLLLESLLIGWQNLRP